VNFDGVVDYVSSDTNNSDQLAIQALVFMAVAVNGSFTIPIAHFFTTGIGAQGNVLFCTVLSDLYPRTCGLFCFHYLQNFLCLELFVFLLYIRITYHFVASHSFQNCQAS
jgi:hypothetical protein